jgi:hypothetical protein
MNDDLNWREKWNKRILLTCRSNRKSLEKWVAENQKKYQGKIEIDFHPKDEWVAYIPRE